MWVCEFLRFVFSVVECRMLDVEHWMLIANKFVFELNESELHWNSGQLANLSLLTILNNSFNYTCRIWTLHWTLKGVIIFIHWTLLCSTFSIIGGGECWMDYLKLNVGFEKIKQTLWLLNWNNLTLLGVDLESFFVYIGLILICDCIVD